MYILYTSKQLCIKRNRHTYIYTYKLDLSIYIYTHMLVHLKKTTIKQSMTPFENYYIIQIQHDKNISKMCKTMEIQFLCMNVYIYI